MADIAQLGFDVKTEELREGTAALNAMVPAAQKVQKATAGVNSGFTVMGSKTAQAAAGLNTTKGAFNNAAAGASHVTSTVNTLIGAVGGLTGKLGSVAPAAQGATTALNRMGRAANDNINAMQATPGNVAAQFQDIGVTAAAGMSPMIIALQQGTQLSAAMSGGVGTLLKGIMQLFTPVTLLTIGMVGLVAAFIQWVDWVKVGQSILNGLASAMDYLADHAEQLAEAVIYLGGVMLVAFAPQILSMIVKMTVAIGVGLFNAVKNATLAMIAFAAANPWTAFVLAVGLAVAALMYFTDSARSTVNAVIAYFVGAYNTIKATWSMLPAAMGDVAIQAANAVIGAIEKMINGSISLLNGFIAKAKAAVPLLNAVGLGTVGNVSLGRLSNPNAGAYAQVEAARNREMQAAQGKDYVGAIGNWASGLLHSGASKLRGLAAGLGADDDGKGKKGRTPHEKAAKPEKSNDDLFGEVVKDAEKQIRALQDASAQIGVYGQALDTLKAQQDLFNAAADKGVKLTDEMKSELNRLAGEIGALTAANRKDNFLEDFRHDSVEAMRGLSDLAGEIGLTGAALDEYRMMNDLLADARKKNISLNEYEIAGLQALAHEQAQYREQIKATKDAIDFLHDTSHAFFADWYNGIMQGKGLIASFADAVVNALNKIVQKLMDRAIDKFLDTLLGGTGGTGGGGFLDTVIKALGGASMLTRSASGAIASHPELFARGGVVDSPTLFAFAQGTGLMGEAGAEAIMPLKRGPDGNLGVSAHGTKGGKHIEINAPVENHYHLAGAISADTIMAMIQRGDKQTQADIKRSLIPWINEQARDGATVG